jgi:hypothetical protein
MITIDLAEEAAIEAERLSAARRMRATRAVPLPDGPVIGVVRRARARRALGRRALMLWRLSYEDAGGLIVESTLVALSLRNLRASGIRDARWALPELTAIVDAQGATWRETAEQAVRSFAEARINRQRAMAATRERPRGLFQAGLFDRRAEQARMSHSRADAERAEQLTARMKAAAVAATTSYRPPELLLILIPSDAARM